MKLKLALLGIQICLKLALVGGGFVHRMDSERYEAVCWVINALFHVYRALKDWDIDYASMALFGRKMLATQIGIKGYKGDQDQTKYGLQLEKKKTFTRFTGHNAFYHLILDHEKWENIHIANTKHLEKTNKTSKDAIRKGAIGTNICNKIMQYYRDSFALTYLIEGNGVDDDGHIKHGGKHRISEDILCQLKNVSWLSFFRDLVNNPKDAQYTQGCDFVKELKDDAQSGISKFTECDYGDDFDGLIEAEFDYVVDEFKLYRTVFFWRSYKKHQVGIGSLICRKSKYLDYSYPLCLVIGMGKVVLMNEKKGDFIIGHTVRLDKYYEYGNPVGIIEDRVVCWSMKHVDHVVRYTHICDNKCRFNSKDEKQHDWIHNKKIALFWFVGVGATGIGDPIKSFDKNKDNPEYHYQ